MPTISSNRVVARFLREADVVRLDLAHIEKLRKDFLVLLKNLPRVKDYKTAHELKKALRVYRERFEDLIFKRFLDHTIKYESKLDENDIKWVNSKLRGPAWTFAMELGSMPIDFKDDYYSEESRFVQYEREVKRWESRIRVKAQACWKEIRDLLEYFTQRGKNFEVDVLTEQVMEIEGFKMSLYGFDPEKGDYSSKWAQEALEILRAGLRAYRTNANKYLPWLIQHQLPVIVNFETTLDKGGEYNFNGTITLYASSLIGEGPKWATHVMAHEMGHYLFKHLDKAAGDYWYHAIRADYKDLDIQELLDKWPESERFAYSFAKEIAKTDPILSLQLDSVGHIPSTSLDKRIDFQDLLDRGVKTIAVPSTPITGYANKNPEEAFCEAIGVLVAYGPGRVPEQVRHWLDVVLPGEVKLSSTVVARYLEKLV